MANALMDATVKMESIAEQTHVPENAVQVSLALRDAVVTRTMIAFRVLH